MFTEKYAMCKPVHYGIDYEINPWMDVKNPSNKKEANREWIALHHTMIRLGVWIDYITPRQGLPDMVFTANAGLLHPDSKKIYLSRFKHKERQGESFHFHKFFEDQGYDVINIQNYFEGSGDAIFCNKVLYCGHGFRSDVSVVDEFENHGFVTIPCKLIDPNFYHLDTCFCPLNDQHALIYPGAFDNETLISMRKRLNLIEVKEDQAKDFVCNCVVLNKKHVLMPSFKTASVLGIVKRIESLGFEVFNIPMFEFIKAGGACRCLTFKMHK